TVGRDGLQHCAGNVLALERTVATGDADARREALDIPFPRTGQRLVEVVDVEDQLPLRRREGAEIRQVRVAAELHGQAGRWCSHEVASHDRGPAPVEREGGD